MVQSYTTQDEVGNHLTSYETLFLNTNFAFHLRKVFEECNAGEKQDQPTLHFVVTAITLHQLL